MSSQIYAKEYEDYLITGKEDCLSTLIPGSLEEKYYHIIQKILKEKYTDKLKVEVSQFIKECKESGKITTKIDKFLLL